MIPAAMHHQDAAIHMPPAKMDIMFYNAIKRARTSYIKRCVLHFIKLILLCVFLPIDVAVLQTTQSLIVAFMATAIAVVVLNLAVTLLIIIFGYGDGTENNEKFVLIAAMLGHRVDSQPIKQNDYRSLANCVSTTIYNQNSGVNNNDPGLTPQIRQQYQNINERMITAIVLQKADCLAMLQKNSKFCSFALIIFGIVALSISQPSSQEIGVLVTFLILEALNVIIILILILLLALSPLIILALCFFCCCCMKEQGDLKLPVPIQATTQIIEKTDGSCSICFQSFIPKQRVIVLPCSQKHVFHQGCLNNWLRVAHTCPLCRKNLNQM